MSAGSQEHDAVIQQNIDNLDVSSFPYQLEPGINDEASHFFLPSDKHDFTALPLKPDHANRPLRVDGLGRLVLDSFHPLFPQAQDFLITISEPVSRPTFVYEYRLTTHSLYAAVSVGLTTSDIIGALDRFSKHRLPPNIVQYISHCGRSYGMVKMVLKNNRYMLETKNLELLQTLLNDSVIRQCRAQAQDKIRTTPKTSHAVAIPGSKDSTDDQQVDTEDAIPMGRAESEARSPIEAVYDALKDKSDVEELSSIHSFRIKDEMVGVVAQRCLALHYPVLEEYDFKNDHLNPNLDIDLRPGTQIRPYQEQSLTKMFGNGRAMSGIIVLPCGAGKTLVGVTAACTIRKGVVVLATSNMSAIQWKDEFIKWSNINPDDIAIFSSENKTTFTGSTGIIITTYSMVTNTRERACKSDEMMSFLQNREWGLMILDEVHVVPAQMFRRVIGAVKAHSKLGLTATLLREDDKIEDLNFLIGPKLYEANWMELSQKGFIARVQCAEVWCAMPADFHKQYRQASPRQRSLFCVMNPVKFQACQYLIKYHESRGDKIIVFSDNVYALKAYAKKLMKPFLHGGTGNVERQEILDYFKNAPECSTLFLSKIGDTSLDLPEATVLIQISAQYGSRRQEAQRLGRVLRAKRRNEEGFNAFFYSLVSKDTIEMVYSSKRQAFLVNQGYAFKIITHLRDMQSVPDLAFNTTGERSELLKNIMREVESKIYREEEAIEGVEPVTDGNRLDGDGTNHCFKRSNRLDLQRALVVAAMWQTWNRTKRRIIQNEKERYSIILSSQPLREKTRDAKKDLKGLMSISCLLYVVKARHIYKCPLHSQDSHIMILTTFHQNKNKFPMKNERLNCLVCLYFFFFLHV